MRGAAVKLSHNKSFGHASPMNGFMEQLVKSAVLYLLRGYKWAISPLFPPACRYIPTCSEYAMEAVERYGAVRGGLKTIWRLLRCHPFAAGGYDPVVRSGRKETQTEFAAQSLRPTER
jgi:uncharacterized protein